ncbi:FAD-binding protein [bacterium CPR1]|nr:FAD-binding protein [bacterium CPR1]
MNTLRLTPRGSLISAAGPCREENPPGSEARLVLPSSVTDRLRELVGPSNLITDPDQCLPYSYDGTALMRHQPAAVVMAHGTDHVAGVLRLANDLGFKVVPRGSGTGLSGGAVPVDDCVVLCTLPMNRVLEIDQQNLTATVEPGVITANLHAAVEAVDLFYPPDPGSMKVCTLGGNVAENAGGLRGLKYGVTRDYVMGLEVVLPTGEVMWTGGKNAKDVAGYNLRQLFVGSEGTLGVFTKILVRLLPRPRARKTMLAVYDRMAGAAETVAAIIAARIIPATLEFLDQVTLRCVEQAASIALPTDAEAVLLMESDGHPAVVEEEAERMAELARKHGARSLQVAATPAEALQLASARRLAFPSLARLRPTTVLEDVSVPRSRLVEMVEFVQRVAREEDLMIGTFGHAGDGNLHPTILMDERNQDEVERMHRAFRRIVEKAVELGGSITGEHGVGLLKKDFMEGLVGPHGLETMRRFRESMDPRQVLNPGKMFSSRPRCEAAR